MINFELTFFSKLILFAVSIGIKHPDPVVETSSLASVEPSNIWYKLSLPENIIDNGELSALQLEAVTYACQRHDIILPSKDRAGFLIGKYSRIFNFIIKSKWVLFHLCIYLDLLCRKSRKIHIIYSSWMAGTSPGLPGIDILEQMIILFSSY